jgi:hypothetical protein
VSMYGQSVRSAGISLLVSGLIWTVWTANADQAAAPPVLVWIGITLLGFAILASRPSRRG